MKKSSLIFFSLIIASSMYFFAMLSPVLYSTDSTNNKSAINKTVITGHRGAAGLAPENTLSSIKKALELNTGRIEVDVVQTKDNIVVCMHDKTIDRTTNGKGSVNEISFSALQKLDAGVKFSKKFKDEKIPSLEKVMQLIDGKAKLVIEIKEGDEVYPGIEKRVVNLINKYETKSWSIVHSFNDSVLLKIHKMDNEIVLHKLLIADFPIFHLIYDEKLRVTNLDFYDFVDEFSCYYPFVTRRLIKKAHSLGKKINVWTVNDSITINHFIKLGIDGIITDYPNFAN